jgi:hypothetical protein
MRRWAKNKARKKRYNIEKVINAIRKNKEGEFRE